MPADAAADDVLCEIPTGSSSHFRYLEGEWLVNDSKKDGDDGL